MCAVAPTDVLVPAILQYIATKAPLLACTLLSFPEKKVGKIASQVPCLLLKHFEVHLLRTVWISATWSGDGVIEFCNLHIFLPHL